MQLAMIGLGRMGGNMVERLMRKGHKVVVYDRSAEAVSKYASLGATPAADLAALVRALETPRVVWIMVPAGDPVDQTIAALRPALAAGDIIIDGGNSNFHDTMRRGAELAKANIAFVDSGTSGGIWGLENGYAHVGPTGAGHYVKMVHNGIEYALLQAYAEGYEILHASKLFPKLDLEQIANVWQHGSVVRSWLNELAAMAFARDASLADIKGWVADSGEGRWTVQEAIDLDVPAPTITLSLLTRFRSRQADSFGAKVIAALRNEFGGHAVKTT